MLYKTLCFLLTNIINKDTIILTMLLLLLLNSGGIIVLSVNELLDATKSELSNLEAGEIFLVRDLFKGYEWNRISRSDRLRSLSSKLSH